jgi:hypothetical protein
MKKDTLIFVAVAGIAGVIAWFGIDSFLSHKPAAPTAAASGEAAPAAASPVRKIPEVLPDFTLGTLEGPPGAPPAAGRFRCCGNCAPNAARKAWKWWGLPSTFAKTS